MAVYAEEVDAEDETVGLNGEIFGEALDVDVEDFVDDSDAEPM